MGQLLGTEINLMEMSEGEYTHLQHLLQTQMDGQATEHDGVDVRFPATIFGLSVTTQLATTQPATPKYDPGLAKMFTSPTIQAMDLSTSNEEQCVIPDLRLNETVDIEELAMVISCSGSGHSGEKTPTTCGEVPGSVLVRVKREAGETLTEAPAHGCGFSLNRPHSSARVCLEKRFSCMAEDVPRQQDTQTAVLTKYEQSIFVLVKWWNDQCYCVTVMFCSAPSFLTMLQQSTESQEPSIHQQMQKWMKSDRTNPIELSNPYGGALFNPITGVCGLVQT